jgi:hypothetical protein
MSKDKRGAGDEQLRPLAKRMDTTVPTGDYGDWCLDGGIVPRQNPKERARQDVGVTSAAVMQAMRDENQFLASVCGKLNALTLDKRFTDRREPITRERWLGAVGKNTRRERLMG